MPRGRLAVLLTTALLLVSVPSPADAQLAMQIVYDASGSMWARVDNKERFLVLNKALEAFLKKVPDDVALSLRVYGARSKADCNDTELAVPFGTGNRDKVLAAVKKLKPLGKTPIQKSLLAAADDLKEQSGKKVIVLVSDGKETCEGDPCETARQLAETEKIEIDVVGFAISDEQTRRQLNCIASVGSGDYIEAANAKALDAGLATVMGDKAPPPEPKIGRILVRVERPAGVLAPTRGLQVDVFEVGNPDTPVSSFEVQNPVASDLPVGSYRVRVRLGTEERVVENVNLENNTVQTLSVDFPAVEGTLVITGKSGGNDLGTRVLCAAFPAGQHEGDPVTAQYGSLPMSLPEGNYDIGCTLLGAAVAPEVWLNNTAVRALDKRELDAVFEMGTMTVRAIGPDNVLGKRQVFSVYPAGERETRLTWSYAGSTVDLPAGKYDVQVEVGDGQDRHIQWVTDVEVTQRKPVEVTGDFRPGELVLVATTGGNSVGNEAKFTVYAPGPEDVKQKTALGWSFSAVPLQLPAGVYDVLVEYQPPQGQVQKQWILGAVVEPGQRAGGEVEFATGQIQVHVLAGGQDLAREGGFSVYLPGEHDKPIAKFDNHAVGSVATGSYDVKAESFYHQYSEWRRDVVVTKDQTTELSVDFPTGKVVVNVLQEGKNLGTGATYYVYPQNEKFKHVAFAFSGSALELVPGVYDVKVTLGPTVKWKQGVFIEASETTTESIEF